MRQIFCIAFLFAWAAIPARAQSDSVYALSRTIEADIVDFTVDNTGNIYLLSKNNQLKKLGPNGDSLAVYNAANRFGDITLMDVTNPLKILLYYKDFSTIVEVDRFFNILNTVDLRSLGIFDVKAIGLAYDNNIWIFDELDAKLKRIGDDGALLDQSSDMRQLFDTVPSPSLITDQGGLVYLYDINKGVYVFDHYGAVKTHMALVNWKDFTVIDKSMIGHNDTSFLKTQPGKTEILTERMQVAFRDAIKITVTPAGIYLLKKNALQCYTRR